MKDCVVKPHCMYRFKRGICRTCIDYNKFHREKNTSAVALGRANKRRGKKSEQKLLLHFERQGLEARIIEGSGAYKRARKDADGDLRVVIKGKERKVENKKRKDFNRIRTLLNRYPIIHIAGFCYAMREEIFYQVLNSRHSIAISKGIVLHSSQTDLRTAPGQIFSMREIPDHQFGWLHTFFNQDEADIVSLDESYKDFILCMTEELFKELVPVRKA